MTREKYERCRVGGINRFSLRLRRNIGCYQREALRLGRTERCEDFVYVNQMALHIRKLALQVIGVPCLESNDHRCCDRCSPP